MQKAGREGNLQLSRSPLVVGLLTVIALAAAAWFLRATFSVTMPLAVGFLLAVILAPTQRWVAAHVPDKLSWLGAVAAMATLVLTLSAVGGFLWFSVSKVTEKAPSYSESYSRAQQWAEQAGFKLPDLSALNSGSGSQESSSSSPGPPTTATGDEGANGRRPGLQTLRSLGGTAWAALSGAVSMLALALLIFFFTLLMLLEGNAFRKRVLALSGSERGNGLDAMDATATKLREYLWVRTIVSLISGALAGGWFLAIGIDFWYLWGFLFFALNYVPFVGSLLAGIPPVVLGFITGGWSLGLLAAGGVLVTENVIGSFVDPKLMGERLAISPVVLLAAMTFFGWAWSWPGLLLAVPLSATFVVFAAHVEVLKPLALLLSNSESGDQLEKRTHKHPATAHENGFSDAHAQGAR